VPYQSFDSVADEYDAVRPDYPAQLFDALESAMGQPLLRAEVLDIGAGTGISSRALAGRGAKVVAVDPGFGVLSLLHARSTDRVKAVVADGNALPLRDGLFDLVTYAQSFHWLDPETAASEAVRVLRPGGVIAMWWNMRDPSVQWYVEHERRLFEVTGQPEHPDQRWAADLLRGPPWHARVARVEVPWRRRISLDTFARAMHTKSYVFALGDRAAPIVDAEMAIVSELFPDGWLDECFVTDAVLARP
jgi:SAM-dependent methyltransferase